MSDKLGPGEFGGGTYANSAGKRSYQLFVPHAYNGQPLPLVVMLHGCKQDPDDFAVGTRMNAVADENGCFVLYPEQSQSANSSLCWNWFVSVDQQRDHGEPSILAELTREIIRSYGIDASRVFVAGMSAGGAMAVILGATYPDIFAAVGVHSGVPYRVAQNLWTALAAMRRGSDDHLVQKLNPMRTIVLHGTDDSRVHPRNGEQVIMQILADAPDGSTVPAVEVQSGVANGRAFVRRIYVDAAGRTLAEQWSIHGSGHAWSGGNGTGSYTDVSGPDASREMLRFFLQLPDPPQASGHPANSQIAQTPPRT